MAAVSPLLFLQPLAENSWEILTDQVQHRNEVYVLIARADLAQFLPERTFRLNSGVTALHFASRLFFCSRLYSDSMISY